VKRAFHVRAVWDPEARVYFSESDIEGLHIETADVDEFESLLFELAPDLVIANHVSANDLATIPMRDLVPAILWQRPVDSAAW
jgi:hypothetical protein